MRILQITEASSAGVGRHVTDLCEALLSRGHDVSLAYSKRRIDATFACRVDQLSNLVAQDIAMRRSPHPGDTIALHQLRRFVARSGPYDVVHAHSSKAGALARMLPRKLAPCIIYTPHCMWTMNGQGNPLFLRTAQFIERTLARRTDTIIAVSPDELQHMRSLGIADSKLTCIVNGVKPSEWANRRDARRQFDLDENHVAVGYLGRLSQQKNPLLLIHAFALLAGDEHVRLLIAGDGELRDAARDAAAKLGIADRITWAGFQNAATYLPALDFFALPSRYEGMPYVLLEALSAGLPIVATDVGGAQLVVDHGKNGFISGETTPHAFAERLRPLIESKQLRHRFSAASNQKSTEFTVEKMVDQTLAVYRNAATDSPVQKQTESTRCMVSAN